MANAGLPISRLINVTVNLSPQAASTQNLSDLLILGSTQVTYGSTPTDVIDTVERYRTYYSITDVASDFGTSAPEYLAALLWFEQSPQPNRLLIGKWAKTATPGSLRGGVVSTANQTALFAVTNGGFKVTVNGTLLTISALNFSALTTMTGVAAAIQTKLQSALAGVVCVWNSVFNRFEITSPTTGALSTLTFLTAPTSGTDVTALLGGLSTSGGYLVDGKAAESALDAVSLFDNNYGQSWYGAEILGAANSDHLAVAGFIEATTTKHTYWVTTQESGSLSSVSTSDLLYQLQQLKYDRTYVQYSSNNAYAVTSAAAKLLIVDYAANNSVIDLMYKQEPGIVPEYLNATQINALEAKNGNVFVAYNNKTAIIEKGNAVSGTPMDIITGLDWLALNIQTGVYNELYLSPTKIPQTDAGNNQLQTVMEYWLAAGVNNGLLAPGTWTQAGFGILKQGDFLPKGFYVYAPPVAQQSIQDRANRKSVSFQIAAKLAGSIREVSISIYANR